MNVVHTIRLVGFWLLTPVSSGRVRHTRNFGQPRATHEPETIWLVCSASPGASSVFVNDVIIGTTPGSQPFAWDVTRHLQPRNRVSIEGDDGQPLGEIHLEMRTATHTS